MAEKDDLAFGQATFDELEADFKKILDELAGEQSLDKFRIEYEKLHRALKTSYENEKKLLSKIKELNNDIVGNAAKVQTALKLTQEDSHTIAFLKSELERAHKVLLLSRERDEKSKQKIENLQTEIKHLTAINEQGQNMAMYKNDTVMELTKIKEQLRAEIDAQQTELTKLKNELNQNIAKLKQIEQEKLIKDTNIKEETKALMEIEEKVKKDEDRKKKMQEELDNLRKNLDRENSNKVKLEDEIKLIVEQINELNITIKDKDTKAQEIKTSTRKLNEEIRLKSKHFTRMVEEKEINEKQKSSNEDEIKKCELQATQLNSNISQLEKNINKLINKKQQLNQQLDTAEKSKEIIIASVNQLERQVIDTKKLNLEDRQFIEELKKAKETLEKSLRKVENVNKAQAEGILNLDIEIQGSEKLILNKNKELDQMNKQISQLEKEKERYGKQAAQANAKYFLSLEEIKLNDNLISELQKKNVETEAKLKQQQTLYEAVRSDRNLYSKNLSETQDEIAEIKRRYKIVNHQISQLKEEIDAKEVALAKEHFEHKKKDKTIEEHSRVLEKYRKDIEEKEEKIKNFVGEISKLHFIIKDSELHRQKLKEEYEFVVAERDILGTQLIRRNDESALLYEKIKIQQRTLANGESAYRERLGDIELLRYKIHDLMRALKIYRKQVGHIPGLKNEIHNLQKELIQEKLKVKALSEELENPLNAHRCRKLEGTDPDIYEMRQKLQTLQRRLISKTEQVVEKEVLKQQKEKQIQELREIMKRQPGIEEAQKISVLQQNLKNRTRQMKSLAAELNMYQAQVNEYKYDIEKLNKDLQETSRKYHEQRKREQLQKESGQYQEGTY